MRYAVLHYIADMELVRGGVVRSVLDLASELARRGHQVTVATSAAVDVPAHWSEPSSPQVLRLQRGAGGTRFNRTSARVVDDAVRSHDVVHFNNLWNPEVLHFAGIARRAGRPYVVTPHGTLDPWSMAQSALKKRVYLAARAGGLLRGAAALHFTADEERRSADRWLSHPRCCVIPYALDLVPFARLNRSGRAYGRPPRVLFLSRLHPKKQPELLIEAVYVLRDKGVDVELLIAGAGDAGYTASLRSLTDELRLADRVEFLGDVTGQAKLDVYDSADLFAVPTSQENFGIVFAEALASGVPTITTVGTDIWRELVATGGALVLDLSGRNRNGSVETLAGAIADLLGDRDRMYTMAEAGRSGVLEWLDTDRVCDSFARMYASAVEARP